MFSEIGKKCTRSESITERAKQVDSYLGQSLLDKLVKDPVLLPDVMSHHRLPVGVVLPIAACHRTDVSAKEHILEIWPLLKQE